MAPDPTAGRKAVAALLKFLARGTAQMTGTADHSARVDLLRQDGRTLSVPEKLCSAAMSRGLIDSREGGVAIAAPGRAALKRLMAGGEDAFAAQHRHLVVRSEGDGAALSVNMEESPLASLSRLKRRDGSDWFGPELVAAGDRLRADFTRGQFMPGMTSRWEPVASRGNAARSGGIADLADAALAARARVSKALDAVGPELSGLLIDVCCYLKGLETVERERLWPQRSAKLLLSAGLQMLARHYDPPRERPRMPVRVWAGEGYRPELGGDLRLPSEPGAPRS